MLRDAKAAAMEQRVSYLEGQVHEQTESLNAARDAVIHLGERLDDRIHHFEERVDARLLSVDTRLLHFEERVDARFGAMDKKIMWLVGIQTTALLAQVAGLIAVVTALMSRY